jgi:hypothetical protein
MKKNKLIISLSLAIAVLFSILFQSIHTYQHLEKQLAQKQCHHKYTSSSEITHQHHAIDHCYVCEFSFGSYVSPNQISYQLHSTYKEIPYFIIAEDTVLSFSGSLYSLRGPPANSLS